LSYYFGDVEALRLVVLCLIDIKLQVFSWKENHKKALTFASFGCKAMLNTAIDETTS
jgi:hypothetical protein